MFGRHGTVLNAVTDWSLKSLFDRTIDHTCPVARRSEVRVELPKGPSPYAITPDPAAIRDGIATYTVDASKYQRAIAWKPS